jgi:hypothetical protein
MSATKNARVFRYRSVGEGFMPVVEGHVMRNTRKSIPINFIVDSGAVLTSVPRSYVGSLIQDLHGPDEDTGARDANGKPLLGLPVEFEIQVTGLPVTCQRVWVCRGESRWGLLGQTWLESFGARFANFPSAPDGRQFALYRSPWPPP